MDPKRWVPLKGGVNFRDLGDYPTKDGRRTKWRKVYRSGAINHLTESDVQELGDRRIAYSLDFREAIEVKAAPDRLPEGTEWVSLAVGGEGNIEDWAQMLEGQDSGVPLMRMFYGSVNELAARYRMLFEKLLALPEDKALLFHCAAGKDRTGMGAALLLEALGVPREEIMKDFLLTNKVRDLLASRVNIFELQGRSISPQVLDDLLTVKETYLEALWESLDKQYGGVMNFLKQELKMGTAEIVRLQDALLE